MRADATLEARVLLSRSPGAADEIAAREAADAGVRDAAARAARELERLGVRALLRGEAGYPAALLDLPDAPRVLFVRGTLPVPGGAVAIVGSRAASPYGIARAEALAADLARLGHVVVSGLARGIVLLPWALPLIAPSITATSPPFHRPVPMSRAPAASTCSLNQSM